MNTSTLPMDIDKFDLNLRHLEHSTIYVRASSSSHLETILKREIEEFGGTAKPIPANISATDFILSLQNQKISHFYENVVGTIEIDTDTSTIQIMYSSNIVHSSVVLLNLVDNALYINASRSINYKDSVIETQYLPIQKIFEVNPNSLEYYAAIIPVGMFFYILFFVTLPFKEEATKFKYLLGISRTQYWFATFVSDVVLHAVMVVLQLFLFQLVLNFSIYNIGDLIEIALSTFVYGIAYLPILYFMATGIQSMSTLSTYLFLMFSVSSIAPLVTSSNQQAISQFEMYISILNILPDFALNHQIRLINENFFIRKRSSYQTSDLYNTSTFYVYMVAVSTLVFFLFLFCWENLIRRQKILDLFKCTACRNKSKDETDSPPKISKHIEFVRNISKESKEADYPLLVNDLTKYYTPAKPAVNNLNFYVKEGHCFGLLGVNGAGKTTTFQMITGNEAITSGRSLIRGIDIQNKDARYKRQIGYCPQYDCLNNFMSAFEILKYMALIRGVPLSEVNKEVGTWLENLDLNNYQNVEIDKYSGGTKRKLNTALAMIASPTVVLLDEPTTGVDPFSRRFIWKCIKDFQKNDRIILLTSHSMDECEYLCNCLAIMVNGQFKCVGHIPKLKKKYGNGFSLNFRVKNNVDNIKIENLNSVILKSFENITLKEKYAGLYSYYVKREQLKWSEVFTKLNELHDEYSELESCSIKETTIEDIFLQFVGDQYKSITSP